MAQAGSGVSGIAGRIKNALHLGADNEVAPNKDNFTGETYDSSNVNHSPLINQKGIGAQGVNPNRVGGTGAGDPTSTTTTTTFGSKEGGTGTGTTATGGATEVLSSSTGAEASRGTADLGDRSELLSSDEHWAKAQAATEEARRQAKIVEAGARSHRESYEEYYKAERHMQKSKTIVEEIETRIRGYNLDAKRAQAKAAREAYEQQRSAIGGLASDAEAARSRAEGVQTDVNSKGRELESLVAASKLHSDRLTQLEAELADLRAAEAEAREQHTTHLADLEPLRQKFAHHKAERSRVGEQLAALRAELDALHSKEGSAQRTLDGHQAEFSALEAELAETEALRAEKERALAERKADLDGISRQHAELTAFLGQKRQLVGSMTKDTQAAMAEAQAKADLADRQAAELRAAEDKLAGHEQRVDASRDALSEAAQQQRALEASGRSAASDVESYAQRASALQAELAAAKERVDLAQAKKEELWELSKREGTLADSAADKHYIEHVARPLGEDPSKMVSKTDHTADLAGKIKYGEQHAIDHQASTAL